MSSFISDSVSEDLNESIHISLTDHIFATIHHIKLKEPISNPFIEEIETLYNEEFKLAEHICQMIESHQQDTMGM